MFTASQRSSGSNEKVVNLTGRVDDKLVKALMPFQREGVEYVNAHIHSYARTHTHTHTHTHTRKCNEI